jgi:hypothetical protein
MATEMNVDPAAQGSFRASAPKESGGSRGGPPRRFLGAALPAIGPGYAA